MYKEKLSNNQLVTISSLVNISWLLGFSIYIYIYIYNYYYLGFIVFYHKRFSVLGLTTYLDNNQVIQVSYHTLKFQY
jgi:hypothetical protein